MDLKQLWEEVLKDLRLNISSATFKTWFKNTSILEIKDSSLVISCQNPYTKEWLERRYQKELEDSLTKKASKEIKLEFRIIPKEESNSKKDCPLFSPGTPVLSRIQNSDNHLNPYYTFENFIVGPTNNLAYAAARAVAENPGHAYNPFFMHGGVGIGKTHLMHAIGNAITGKKRKNKVIYVTSETFTNDLIDSFRKNKTDQFRKNYREADILIIDDIQFISGKESIQEEFFHTFNALYAINRQIIVSSDRPPQELEKLESRLRSRFEGGLIVDIQSPDFETRCAILLSKCEERKISLPRDVISFIAENVTENVRQLEGTLTQLISYASFSQIPIDLQAASKIILKNSTHKNDKAITPKIVLEKCASFYRLPIQDLKGKSRRAEVVLPRQIIMYLLRKELQLGLDNIGTFLGNRDHSTIIHGIEKVDLLVSKSGSSLKNELTTLRTFIYEE